MTTHVSPLINLTPIRRTHNPNPSRTRDNRRRRIEVFNRFVQIFFDLKAVLSDQRRFSLNIKSTLLLHRPTLPVSTIHLFFHVLPFDLFPSSFPSTSYQSSPLPLRAPVFQQKEVKAKHTTYLNQSPTHNLPTPNNLTNHLRRLDNIRKALRAD